MITTNPSGLVRRSALDFPLRPFVEGSMGNANFDVGVGVLNASNDAVFAF